MCYGHPIVLFPVFLMGMLGGLQVLGEHMPKEPQEVWKKRVDYNAGFYIVLVCALSIGNLYSSTILPKNAILSSLLNRQGVGLMFQWIFVRSQLTVVIGLCLDGGTSLTSNMLRTAFFQFLGRISLALYIVQNTCRDELVPPALRLVQNYSPILHHEIVARIIIFAFTPMFAFVINKAIAEPASRIAMNYKK